MEVTTRQGKAFLNLDGELTVARAADLKEALLKALEKADNIEIHFQDVTGIDLSCLQLFCSAHRTAAKEGKMLTVKDPSLPMYVEARKDAGFMYTKPCQFVTTGDCLWVGEKE